MGATNCVDAVLTVSLDILTFQPPHHRQPPMDALQEPGDILSHAVRDIVRAVSERPGENRQQQYVRARVATTLIEELRPRDGVQLMLAGHSMMFHEMMIDSVHETLRGEVDTQRRGTRANIVSMNHAFLSNLDRLDRYRNSSVARVTAEVESPRAGTPATSGPSTGRSPAEHAAAQAVRATRNEPGSAPHVPAGAVIAESARIAPLVPAPLVPAPLVAVPLVPAPSANQAIASEQPFSVGSASPGSVPPGQQRNAAPVRQPQPEIARTALGDAGAPASAIRLHQSEPAMTAPPAAARVMPAASSAGR